jgi:hypothetical protein
MYIDALNRFSNAQALTTTAVSTDVIDTVADANLGVGEPMAIVITVGVTADDANADETYVAELQSSTDEAFTSPIAIASVSIPRGSVAGSKFVIGVPPTDSGSQFYRLSYTLAGTTPSVTVTSFITLQSMIQNDYTFASGFTIS